MPARRKQPLPTVRMIELLSIEKRKAVEDHGRPTLEDFEAAWEASWATLRREKRWPHQTRERRGWWAAMASTKSEFRAAFLDQPSAFGFAVGCLSEAASGMCVTLVPDQIPGALIAAIAYSESRQDEEADQFSGRTGGASAVQFPAVGRRMRYH